MTSKTKKIIGATVAAVFLGGAAFALGQLLRVGNAIGGKEGGIVKTWQGMTNPLGQFPEGTQRINILLIGKDYNHNNKGILYTKGSRSDTLIMFSLDLQNHTISALSIPRDTYIPERRGKINAAYAQGGAPMAMDTVGKLLGVRPDHFIALKSDGIKNLVDQLGGVEITSLDAMKYDDNWGGLHVNLPPGTYEIDGEQAIGYSRFRKSNPGLPHSKEEGDSRRMARQQNLIRAMIAKAKTPEILMNAPAVIDTAYKQVETDLKPAQLVALATIFREAQPDKITSGTLQGEDGRAGGLYVFKPDEEKTKYMVDWLLRGDESAANALTNVAVQNGTEIRGVARRLAGALKDNGYDAHSDGNAPGQAGENAPTEYQNSKIVYYKASVAPRAQNIARLLGVSAVEKGKQEASQEAASTEDTGEHPADVLVIVGRDLADSNFGEKQSASRN